MRFLHTSRLFPPPPSRPFQLRGLEPTRAPPAPPTIWWSPGCEGPRLGGASIAPRELTRGAAPGPDLPSCSPSSGARRSRAPCPYADATKQRTAANMPLIYRCDKYARARRRRRWPRERAVPPRSRGEG
eukprot:299219-Chlamydomonas_euryale.AAC.5